MVFTGIVKRVASAEWDLQQSIVRIKTDAEFWRPQETGDSIAVNGVCLTLLEKPVGEYGRFFVMEETFRKTIFAVAPPKWVNLEAALRVGDSYGGHRVSGHVNGAGVISGIQKLADGSHIVSISLEKLDPKLENIRYKGSVAIDGISLTVADRSAPVFKVSVIPHTWENTILQYKSVGDLVNIEFDQDQRPAVQPQGGDQSQEDNYYMQLAIQQGELGRYTASPNPWVGAVIVRDGKILGQGHHHKAGTSHAEVVAVGDADSDLTGSTLYCTLEPCSHFGRTGPCVDVILKHAIKRVVVGVLDPDPRVSGTGVQRLRDAGLEVVVGVMQQAVEQSLRPYLHQRQTGRPYVVLKMAMSLDGKIKATDGSSQWLTSESARQEAHRWRARSQAVIVGAGTVKADNPRLDVRLPDIVGDSDFRQPLRVVLDSRTEPITDKNLNVYNSDMAETIFWSGDEQELLALLAKRQVVQVMIEGGAKVASRWLKLGLVDRLVVHYGNVLLGGQGNNWVSDSLSDTLSAAMRWKLVSVNRFEDTVEMVYDK